MMDKMHPQQDDGLRRKLNLLMGTPRGFDWMDLYIAWCEQEDVTSSEFHDDRTVRLFVKHRQEMDK